jgi:tape measure domain-containing protein
MSSITFDSSLDTTGLEAGIRRANRSIENWVQGVEKQASGLDHTMQRIGGGIAAYFSVRELAMFAKQVIETRGQFQQLNIAFETMLDSKEKADKLMAEAITFSQKTPFTLTDVASNIKQLMAMGIETDKVMETMKSLGDVAAGVSVPIGRLAINYGQVATMGKLQGRELRDFAMAGVPLVEELAKMLGKSKDQIQEMVSAGKIGFPLVEQAFKNMASEGGKFYNLMEKQSASLTGQISNLSDKWQVMLNDIGQANEGIIYSGISGLGYLVANYQQVIEVLKGLVLVLGAAKVASMYVAYENKVQAAMALLAAGATDKQTLADARWIVMQERKAAAQRALNKSMLANPYVLAAAAIAALGFGIYKLITYETDLEKAVKKTNLEIENEKDKALDLFSALKATKEGTEKYEQARQKIIDQYGQYIPEQNKELKNLQDIKIAQDAVNLSIAENIAVRTRSETLESISGEYNPKVLDVQKNIIEKVEKELGKERAAMVKQEIAGLIAEYKAGLPGAEKALIDYRNKLMSEVGKINDEGFATSFKSANMAGAFNSLLSILQDIRIETDAANDAFDKYITGFNKKPEPTKGKTIEITADEQRLQLKKQLAEEEKKLKELETKPGKDPLKAIEEQKQVIKDLKERLDLNEEILTLDDKIAEQEELLQKAIADSNKEEIKAISDRIVALQNELYLREKIKKEAIAASIARAEPITKISTGIKKTFGTKVEGTLAGAPDAFAEDRYIPGTKMLSEAGKKKQERESEKIRKEQEEADEQRIRNQEQLLKGATQLTYEMGRQLGMSEEELQTLGSMLDVFERMATGDYIGAGISMISLLIQSIPSEAAEFEAQIGRINRLLEKQQRLIELSQRTGGTEQAMRDDLDLQTQAIAEMIARRDKIQRYGGEWWWSNKKTKKEIEELNIMIEEAQNNLEDAQLALDDFLAGNVTQNTIADALAQGFQDGKASVNDFADYMNDILLNAVTDIFKKQTLLPLINEQLYPIITEYLEDGILTDDEAKVINDTTNNLVNSVMEKWKASTEGLNLGEGAAITGRLSGQIQRSITEDTGTELAGLMRKISDDNRMNRDYNKLSVEHLIGIEANTYQTVAELKLAVAELKTISTNTKPAYSGIGGA